MYLENGMLSIVSIHVCAGKTAILLRNKKSIPTSFKLPFHLDEILTWNIKLDAEEVRILANTKKLI